jgi:hypothetical protein
MRDDLVRPEKIRAHIVKGKKIIDYAKRGISKYLLSERKLKH